MQKWILLWLEINDFVRQQSVLFLANFDGDLCQGERRAQSQAKKKLIFLALVLALVAVYNKLLAKFLLEYY